VSPTPDSTLADPEQLIADLRRQLAECKAERDEAQEQQTATAEVLGVINSSPGDLAPVFDAILEKAHKLCGVAHGALVLREGEIFRAVATHSYSGSFAEQLRQGYRGADNPLTRPLIDGERFVHIPDLVQIDHPMVRASVENAGVRTGLYLPLRKDGVLLGMISSCRKEIRPFSDKEIALLENFAAQGVIAMENARLLTETREALEQQTAAAEVLGVINSSPGDLAPVFDAMLGKAMDLCEAAFGGLFVLEGEQFRAVATRGLSVSLNDFVRQGFTADQSNPLLRGAMIDHIVDLSKRPLDKPGLRAAIELGGARTMLNAALRKDDAMLGSFSIFRREVRPFSDKQIALLQNFAAQAVIAMENARLLTETREVLEQQTATAEVLQVINSSPGDLAPVFDAILEKAHSRCGAEVGTLAAYDGKHFHALATFGYSEQFAAFLRRPFLPNVSMQRLIEGERVLHLPDQRTLESEPPDAETTRAFLELTDLRTTLFVALRKDTSLLGYISAHRHGVLPFSEKQIALLQNFAAQAVIAMENARLITETREALEQQTATAEVLGVINSSPGDLKPVFDAILDKAHNLCGAEFGSLFLYDGGHFRAIASHGVPEPLVSKLREGIGANDSRAGQQLMAGAPFAHIHDSALEEHAVYRGMDMISSHRTLLSVPLRKGDVLLGMIVAGRLEVRPFTDKQIALLQNFASQAMIAMENARLLTETREALEQQTATAEVLQVINFSPGDLARVFEAMLENAMRLCGAAFGVFATYQDAHYRVVAAQGVPPGLAQLVRQPVQIRPGSMPDRLRHGEDTIQIADITTLGPELRTPGLIAMIELGNARTAVWVALRKDGIAQGFFGVYRQEVRPFTDKQIALLQNFAAQAVIAMENARLLTETREALEQQTATAEVLQVINSSPGNLTPVFDAMLEKAHTLCGAPLGSLVIYDGEHLRAVATRGYPAKYDTLAREGFPARGSPLFDRLLEGEPFVHVADTLALPLSASDHPIRHALREIAGVRSLLAVPLRNDNRVLGYISAQRQELRPFTDKEIALLQNFAAQAVIGMENARLLTETREALEQQTATAEVLQVINSSPGDLAPVFDAILEKAHALCGAEFGGLGVFDGEQFRVLARHGVPDFSEISFPVRPGGDAPVEQLAQGKGLVHIADVRLTDAYREHPGYRANMDSQAVRTLLGVPLRKDGALLGAITAFRREVRPFSDKQIALLQNFAAQAVIGMENARLLTETREALEQQTATAEVLQVINSSPGDLAPVFDAMLEKAHTLCGAAHGVMVIREGEEFRTVAANGEPAFVEAMRQFGPMRPPDGSGAARLLRGEQIVHIFDYQDESFLEDAPPQLRRASELGRIRTVAMVPLLKDDVVIGFITAFRQEVRPFSDKQIALLQNFAAQAVIAIENARLLTETREALEQQTATAEVLQVINSSPGDLAPVFDVILEKAMRLCEAAFGVLWTFDGEIGQVPALRGVPPAFAEFLTRGPHRETSSTANSRLRRGENVVQIADSEDDDAYRSGEPVRRAMVELGGARTMLAVPLRKDGTLLGSFIIYRQEVRLFSDKQIGLLQNFAAQAVIAMENARLLTETRESLEQQTATAEVLQVINSSPGDLQPVFDAILEKAHTICGVDRGVLQLYDGEYFRAVATHGLPEAVAAIAREPNRPAPGELSAQLLAGVRFAQAADLAESEAYRAGAPSVRAVVDIAGTRSVLWVPLRKDGVLLGAISAARTEVRPFSDKEIALLENFAAQAVIAIENARLINETREALEQQTATAEVLQVINSSPGELTPVFEAILKKAHTLCGAPLGSLVLWDGEQLRAVATRGYPQEYEALARQGFSATSAFRRVLSTEPFVHVPDPATPGVPDEDLPIRRAAVEIAGVRTALFVPLRKEATVLGYISAQRQEARPFSEKQIALLQNFAAQAVIAMENARLLTETREALEQQTATAEVLQVINSSPGDLAPVFDAMLEKALRLCEAAFGTLVGFDGERFHNLALRGLPAPYVEYLATTADQPGPGGGQQRVLHGERVVHFADMKDDEAYRSGKNPMHRAMVDIGGARTGLIVPLRKDDAVVGTFTIYRQEVRPFSDKQIALLQNFAAQAVIAMENARLLTETREALEQQTATAEVLQVINSSPGDLTPVFDAMLEKAMRLCEAAFGIMLTYDGQQFQHAAVQGVPDAFAEHRRRNPSMTFPPRTNVGRHLQGENVVHIVDLEAEDTSRAAEQGRALLDLGGARTLLSAALRKDGSLLGVLSIYRQEVRPFSDKQIALLENFAAQAVIAMENARLIGELHERTDQVAELNRGLEARVAEQVEELGRVGRLKRFLAPQLAELIVSHGDEKILESHRREIVVVFCDLRGYTAFTETAEPEEVLDFLREYHGALGPLVSQFEGTLDQFSGDGIMVFFNDPVPIPDPAERAVKMAVAMREAAGTLIADWRERGRDLGFGAGIAQGYATLGQIGFSERSGYTAIGTVCNVAARLCAEAKDGQILLSQRVNVALRGSVATEQVGALALKGLTQPVVAYNVPLAGSQAAFRVIEGGAPSA
jgi:GAF domain-containing protein